MAWYLASILLVALFFQRLPGASDNQLLIVLAWVCWTLAKLASDYLKSKRQGEPFGIVFVRR